MNRRARALPPSIPHRFAQGGLTVPLTSEGDSLTRLSEAMRVKRGEAAMCKPRTLHPIP